MRDSTKPMKWKALRGNDQILGVRWSDGLQVHRNVYRLYFMRTGAKANPESECYLCLHDADQELDLYLTEGIELRVGGRDMQLTSGQLYDGTAFHTNFILMIGREE